MSTFYTRNITKNASDPPLQAVSVFPGSDVVEEQPCLSPISELSTAMVVGGTRGIGLELVEQLLAKGAIVIATHRGETPPAQLIELQGKFPCDGEVPTRLRILELDVADEKSILIAREKFLSQPKYYPKLTHIIHNSGIYGPRVGLGSVDAASMMEVYQVNTVGLMIVAQTFLHNAEDIVRCRDSSSSDGTGRQLPLFSVVSSVLGSIDENQGGGYMYRASKAAANIVAKSLAVDLTGKVQVLLLHPGYVQTDLTGGKGDIDRATSATGIIKAIEATGSDTPFRFVDYKGRRIPW